MCSSILVFPLHTVTTPIYTVCHLHYTQPANIHSMSFTLYTTSQYTQYVIYTIYNHTPIYTLCHLHYIQPANIHSMSFTLYTTSQYAQYVIYTIYNQTKILLRRVNDSDSRCR